MRPTICGLDCDECEGKATCPGCSEAAGVPHGGSCVLASCRQGEGRCRTDGSCWQGECRLKQQLLGEYNALGIPDMPTVTELYALPGSYINLTYTLPSGQPAKLLRDNKFYLGNQLEKKGTARCYGLAADEDWPLVCEYGENGTDAEIVRLQKRKR